MNLLWRSLLWTVLCPGIVTLIFPAFLLARTNAAPGGGWRIMLGTLLLIPGIVILGWCIRDFYRHGKGTLSPADPTRRLVVQGLYRYMRNPMYAGVILILAGEIVLFNSLPLLIYAGVVFIAFNLFVILHEEPSLRKKFGQEYEVYCMSVNRWLPGKPFKPH